MEIAIVLTTTSDGLVDSSVAIWADNPAKIVMRGKHVGKTVGAAAELEFAIACHRINSLVPPDAEEWVEVIEDAEHLLEDMPNLDDGYYEFDGKTVQLHWATSIIG